MKLEIKYYGLGIAENDIENYYILYKQDFEEMQIENELKNPQDEIYVVNYDKQEIMYMKGYVIEGNTKYNISDIISEQNKVTERSSNS